MTLQEKYVLARWCYAIGEDFISDMEYRQIEERLRQEDPENEYLKRSWSDDPCPVQLLKRNGMEELIRDVEFTHESESIRSIYNLSEYTEQYLGLNEKTFVSYKIDGWNTQVNYYNGEVVSANTRGRSGNFLSADVVMEIVPKRIPVMGKVKITGEVSIRKSKWRSYAMMTGNTSQRNSVATILANGDKEYASFCAFNVQTDGEEIQKDRYDLLTEWGFQTPLRMIAYNFSTLDRVIKILSARDEKYDYLTDGVVVENSKGQIALRIYRWEEKCFISYVTGYIENRGAYGDSIVVSVYPLVRDGITRTKVSVTNLKYVVNYNLRVGFPIAFDIRSSADAVLNTTKTIELQEQWRGRYEEFCKLVEEEKI